MSQAEFAKFIGVPNQATYQRYEAGRIPRPPVLHQIAIRLGIEVDELLMPMDADRAFEITALAFIEGPARAHVKMTEASVKAIGKGIGELVTSKNVKAIADAFRLKSLSWEELSSFFEHIVSVANRAPVHLMKFYALIRRAIAEELATRMKLK